MFMLEIDMELAERLKILIDTSVYIVGIYNDNIANENIGHELRHLMADNIVVLNNMLEQAENLQLFDQDDPEIINLTEELFEVFNDCIVKNTEIVNQIH